MIRTISLFFDNEKEREGMNIKVSFKNMPHSNPMELHANQKLAKVFDLLKNQAEATPFNIELWLKANKQHPHHSANLHIKTAFFDLNSHDEGPDMYVVIDNAVDKMVIILKKEKARFLDKVHKPKNNPKKKFSS